MTGDNKMVLVKVFGDKSLAKGPRKIVISDERLENSINLYRKHIRPKYIRGKEKNFLFLNSKGKRVRGCYTAKM